MPPSYVKPFVKRQKNDASDAEAICEAALRPTMRFVAVKEEEKQSAAAVFKTRDLLVRQRTQTINALRGHLAEFGIIVPKGPAHVGRLIEEAKTTALPASLRVALDILIAMLGSLNGKIKALEKEIAAQAERDADAKRLRTIPGVGPITAAAVLALAPPAATFKRGRDFAAWVGLTPLQKSTGGKTRLGATSKMGERTLRRLLIIGASAVVRWAAQRGAPKDSWLERMLARKPRMVVIVALANKMARTLWALLAKGGTYKASAATA